MIHDEDLKNSLDYSEGQKEAAHRVLMELINLFMEYTDIWNIWINIFPLSKQLALMA